MLSSSDKFILGQRYLRFFRITYTRKERKELIFFQLKLLPFHELNLLRRQEKDDTAHSMVPVQYDSLQVSTGRDRNTQQSPSVPWKWSVGCRFPHHSVERSLDKTSSLVSLATDPRKGALRF